MFPPHNSTLVDAQGGGRRGRARPARRPSTLIQAQLTDENMQELNARVDIDKKDPAAVARRLPARGGSHQVAADLDEPGEPALEQVRVLGLDLDGQLEPGGAVR